jgi:23S rRNA (cytidine1920-2'-O)/16S rRNA (cytidine1409-2'-O)-methyltransferase
MVRRGIAGGRDEAKRLIGTGSVTVDGSSMVKASTLVADSAAISLAADEPSWASRGALKLEHAIGVFDLDPKGVVALDVGASTGGFTDVLLEAGAASVTCVDVGYGQMVWRLSQDRRVTVVDRTNFRTVDPDSLGGPFGLVVMDVSFISVRLLTSQLAAVGTSDADYVVLVKPQFEVGRDGIGRGGIVTDPLAHAAAVRDVAAALAGDGIGAVDLVGSPITGSKGNQEFLLHARLGRPLGLTEDKIAEVTSP